MKYILLLFTAALLLFNGCEEAFTKSPLLPAESLMWQGGHPIPPEEPKENWVYFDTELKETRIFNGEIWETMAVSGIDATSLRWLGALSTFPMMDTNIVFFHTEEKVSYICDGVEWSIFNSNGKDGLGLIWKGKLTEAPLNPEKNWYYYDTVKKASFIYSDFYWQQFNADGLNGRPVIWLGPLNNFPSTTEQNVGFYHSVEGITYIMDDLEWKVLSRDGLKGEAGELIVWKGDLETPPSPALNNWAYYNTVDGQSYIYDLEKETWFTLSKIGKNGEPIHWLGIFDEHPDDLKINNAYRNTQNGNCYIFNGKEWELFSFGAIDGENGIDGLDVVWMGLDTKHPESPEINWAYLNIDHSCSYIYTEKGWEVLLKNGENGFEIKLIGSFDTFPPTSNYHYGHVFYHIGNNTSYILTENKQWKTFCKGGADAVAGTSIIWKGELYAPPYGYAKKNWMYYHIDQRITYIYTDGTWSIVCFDGADGVDGEINFLSQNEEVGAGDSVVLYHNFGSNNITLDGRYLSEDSMYVDWTTPSDWSSYFGIVNPRNIYGSYTSYPSRKMLKLRNGSIMHAFATYNGGYYGVFVNEIPAGEVKQFTELEVYDLNAAELDDGTLLFTYKTWDNEYLLTSISPAGELKTLTISEDAHECKMTVRKDGIIFLSYIINGNDGCFKTINKEGVLSNQLNFSQNCTKYSVLALDDGTVMISYPQDGVFSSFISPSNALRIADKWGPSTVESVNNMIQTTDGSIYIDYGYVSGGKVVRAVSKLTPLGDSLATHSFTIFNGSVELVEMNNGLLGAINVHYDAITGHGMGVKHHTGYPYFSMFDANLEETYRVRLAEEVTEPEMIAQPDGSFVLTYVDKFDEYSVKTAKLEERNSDLGIFLKRLSTNHACLINNTGNRVKLQLSARKYE